MISPLPHWLDHLPPSADCLRLNQRAMIADIRDAIAGYAKPLVQGATGFGKTHVIAALTAAAQAAELRVLVLVTRTRLARQIHERFEAFGIPHGVIAAPLPELSWSAAKVQIASVDTLYRRALVDKRMPLPSADVVVFDEAHLSLGETRVAILEQYPDAYRIGFTATPAGISGRPLADQYDVLILGPSVKSLIEAGDLVRPRIFSKPAATERELAAITKDGKTGDYVVGELGELMSRPKLVGDVVANWLRIANGKRTLCFACNKAHGAALTEEFLQAGIAAELLTDQDAEPDREQAIYRLETGATKVIVNCFLMSYGTDVPTVECVVLARPTRSVVLYLQTVGRGMRPAPGKDHVLVIDHGRVVESLGLPHEDFAWSLDEGNVNTSARTAAAERARGEERTRLCPECSHLWLVSEEGPACTCCGWAPAPKPKPVLVQDADLHEIDDDTEAQFTPHDTRVVTFYREACGDFARRKPDQWMDRPKSLRWAAWCETRAKFRFPDTVKKPGSYWDQPPFTPSLEVSGWLHHRRIKFARSRPAVPA
jgi:DNA repair protein RadD